MIPQSPGSAPPSLDDDRVESSELAGLVEARLRETSHSALRRVTCEFHDGTLTLRGVVPSFYLKQLAQSLARKSQEVERVVNQIHVGAPEASDEEHRWG